MNTECNRIADQLASVINGEAWYGDPLRKILDNVGVQEAQAHPIPGAHSIWELVHHMDAWVTLTLGAVQGTPMPAWSTMPKEMDWPPVRVTDEQAWQQAVTSLFSNHSALVDAIRAFGDDRLETTVPGRKYPFYRLFHGMTQHAVYHGGQIALLKKATVTG